MPTEKSVPSFELLDEIDFVGLKVAVLRTTLDLDLLTKVAAGATTVPALAAACAASERGVRVLVRALLAIGLLDGSDAAFTPSRVAEAYLVDGAAGDARAIFASWLQNRDALTESVRSGVGPGRHDEHDAEDDWQSFASPDIVRWPQLAPEIVELLAGRGVVARPGDRILDFGSGSALSSLALARATDGVLVTAVDRAAVLTTATRLAAEMGLSDRLTIVAGDVDTVVLPEASFDLALFANVAQYLDDARFAAALRRLRESLRSGGTVYVVSAVVTDDDPGHMTWATNVEMFLASNIDQRDVATITRMMTDAGFTEIRYIAPTRFVATAP